MFNWMMSYEFGVFTLNNIMYIEQHSFRQSGYMNRNQEAMKLSWLGEYNELNDRDE